MLKKLFYAVKITLGIGTRVVERVGIPTESGVVTMPIYQSKGMKHLFNLPIGACATWGFRLHHPFLVPMIMVDAEWDGWSHEERQIVIAHEVGHIVLDHLLTKPRSVGEAISREKEATEVGCRLYGIEDGQKKLEKILKPLMEQMDPSALKKFIHRSVKRG